jgi:hypothetical protein
MFKKKKDLASCILSSYVAISGEKVNPGPITQSWLTTEIC